VGASEQRGRKKLTNEISSKTRSFYCISPPHLL
jgi:hypothetical protein